MEKIFFALSPRTDEIEAVKAAQPENVLLSYALWSKKDLGVDFIARIGYQPRTLILDSGAFTFHDKAKKAGEVNPIVKALDAMILRHRRAWALATPIGYAAWRGDVDPEDEEDMDLPVAYDYATTEEFADAILEYLEESYLDEFELGGVSQVDYISNAILSEAEQYQATRTLHESYYPLETELTLFHEFVKFVWTNRTHITYTVSMDVIGDATQSRLGFEILEAIGLNPVPVFGYFDDIAVLDQYVQEGHELVMLGGSVGQKKTDRIEFANKVALKYPGVKFHLLGTLDAYIIERIADNVYSVDGTAWNASRKERRYEGRTKVEQSAWNIKQRETFLAELQGGDLIEENGGQLALAI